MTSEVRMWVAIDRPHHPARADVDRRSREEPGAGGPDVGDVAAPAFVQALGGEVALDEVRHRWKWLRSLLRTAFVDEFGQRLVITLPADVHEF